MSGNEETAASASAEAPAPRPRGIVLDDNTRREIENAIAELTAEIRNFADAVPRAALDLRGSALNSDRSSNNIIINNNNNGDAANVGQGATASGEAVVAGGGVPPPHENVGTGGGGGAGDSNSTGGDDDDDDDSDETDDDDDDDDDSSMPGLIPVPSSTAAMFPFLRRDIFSASLQEFYGLGYGSYGAKPVKCPVCKAVHRYKQSPSSADGGTTSISMSNRCSHDARVVFCSVECPICLDDDGSGPMVALACGHLICREDFKSIGGKVGEESMVSSHEAARKESEERRLRRQRMFQENRRQLQEERGLLATAVAEAAASFADRRTTTNTTNNNVASAPAPAVPSSGNGNSNNGENGDDNNNDGGNGDDDSVSYSSMPALVPRRAIDSDSDSSDDGIPNLLPDRPFGTRGRLLDLMPHPRSGDNNNNNNNAERERDNMTIDMAMLRRLTSLTPPGQVGFDVEVLLEAQRIVAGRRAAATTPSTAAGGGDDDDDDATDPDMPALIPPDRVGAVISVGEQPRRDSAPAIVSATADIGSRAGVDAGSQPDDNGGGEEPILPSGDAEREGTEVVVGEPRPVGGGGGASGSVDAVNVGGSVNADDEFDDDDDDVPALVGRREFERDDDDSINDEAIMLFI